MNDDDDHDEKEVEKHACDAKHQTKNDLDWCNQDWYNPARFRFLNKILSLLVIC